jgi:hypothetical protein
MRIRRKHYRAGLSVLLALTLSASLSLSSIAASDAIDETITDSLLVPQELTGTLTVKGTVLVNGNDAKTGATIANGNVIQTQGGSHATIDLGATGRVELDQLTAITLTMTPNSIHASLDKCGMGVTLILPAGVNGQVKILNVSDVGVLSERREIDVRAYRGEALVKYGQGKEKIVKTGDHKEFDDAIDVTATGDAVFKVYCDENHYPLLLWAGLAAIFIPLEAIGGPVAPLVSPITP